MTTSILSLPDIHSPFQRARETDLPALFNRKNAEIGATGERGWRRQDIALRCCDFFQLPPQVLEMAFEVLQHGMSFRLLKALIPAYGRSPSDAIPGRRKIHYLGYGSRWWDARHTGAASTSGLPATNNTCTCE